MTPTIFVRGPSASLVQRLTLAAPWGHVPPPQTHPGNDALLCGVAYRNNQVNIVEVQDVVENVVAMLRDRGLRVLGKRGHAVIILADNRVDESIQKQVGLCNPDIIQEILHAGARSPCKRPVSE